MSDATNLPGVLGAYAAAFQANDIQRMRQIVLEVVAADEIVLPHPETGIICRCRSSARQGMGNLLFFSDEFGENAWCLVQMGNFFQFAVTATSVISISFVPDIFGDRLISKLRSGEYDHYWSMRHDYGGLIVSSPRPYHYFYDQLLHLPDIINNIPEGKRTVHVDNTVFLSPKTVWEIPTKNAKNNKYYIFPNVVGGLRLHSKGKNDFF